MYIISKYKDYYDGAVGMGIDKTIVYERKIREEDCPKELSETLNRYGGQFSFAKLAFPKNVEYTTKFIHVGFCGKIYVGIQVHKKIADKYSYDDKTEIEVLWDHDIIRKKLNSKVDQSKYFWYRNKKSDLENFNNYVAKLEAYDATKWFREFHTPIFALTSPPVDDTYWWRQEFGFKNDDSKLYINPRLKDYQFAKVFDPYTAFQEVQMYVSGVLGVNKDGTEIPATEKQKVAQHGMNKWSFRRPPSK